MGWFESTQVVTIVLYKQCPSTPKTQAGIVNWFGIWCYFLYTIIQYDRQLGGIDAT